MLEYVRQRQKEPESVKLIFGTKSDLVAWKAEERECKDNLQLDDYAQLFTNFDRHYSFEHIPPKFVRGSAKEPDCFDDEICLLRKTDDGTPTTVNPSEEPLSSLGQGVVRQHVKRRQERT